MATRISDSELDTYHGGREAYLAQLRKSLAEAQAETYQPGNEMAAFFGQDSQADFDRCKADKIAQLQAAIAINS